MEKNESDVHKYFFRIKYTDDLFLRNLYSLVLKRIVKRCGNPFNISEISSSFFMSERSMYRRLKEKGITYFEIRENVRMEYAGYLLSLDKYSIEEISRLIFFKSSSSFIYAFKRYFGVTPGKWLSSCDNKKLSKNVCA